MVQLGQARDRRPRSCFGTKNDTVDSVRDAVEFIPMQGAVTSSDFVEPHIRQPDDRRASIDGSKPSE
jgi:hypothetical protein